MNLGSFRILLPFFRISWSVGVLNSAIFNIFHNRVKFGMGGGFRNFGGGGLNTPNPPSRYATGDIITNAYSSSCKEPAILVIFHLNFSFLDRLPKNPQISNFTKIRPVGTELFHEDK